MLAEKEVPSAHGGQTGGERALSPGLPALVVLFPVPRLYFHHFFYWLFQRIFSFVSFLFVC